MLSSYLFCIPSAYPAQNVRNCFYHFAFLVVNYMLIVFVVHHGCGVAHNIGNGLDVDPGCYCFCSKSMA